jgi:sulfur carrier protein ThiS adenylyltransferase
MNDFDKTLLGYFSQKELGKIKKTKLLIIGCGGLGSNVAAILTRTGFSDVVLTDFDVVNAENLNRQNFLFSQCGMKKVVALKKNLLEINPWAKIKTIFEKIDGKKLRDIILREKIDVIIEAVDATETKKVIFEESLKLKKRVVGASGIAGYGDCENIKIKRGKNFSVIGDMIKSTKDFKPFAPKVSTVAAMQADEVLRMVLDNE